MKNYFYTIMLLATAIFWSCQEEELPSLTLSEEELTIEALGDTLNILVFCNVDSKATVQYDSESGEGWLLVLPRVLKNDGVLTLFVKPNGNILSDRGASVIVTAGKETKTIRLTQLAKDGLEVSPTFVEASDTGGSYTVTVTCNKTWNAMVNSDAASWCTLGNSTGGQGANPLTVNVAALGVSDGREATITITSDNLNATFKVSQGDVGLIAETLYDGDNVNVEDGWKMRNPQNNGDCATLPWGDFSREETNPDKTDINSSDKCWYYIKGSGGNGWSGIYHPFLNTLTKFSKLTMMVRKSAPGQVWIQSEDGSQNIIFMADYTETGKWQKLTFTLDNIHVWSTAPPYTKLGKLTLWIHMTDTPPTQRVDCYFDDLKIYYNP